MTKPVWTELDFRLSVVNRWQVMPTIRKQSVAEHQHNVAKIAERLAVEVWGIKDHRLLYQIVMRALEHDDLEAIIGDPPSYVKPFIDESGAAQFFQDMQREPRFPGEPHPGVKVLVKAADYIDALTFLMIEQSMGNKTINSVLVDLDGRFRRYCTQADNQWLQIEGAKAIDLYEVWADTAFELFNGNDQQLTIEGFRF